MKISLDWLKQYVATDRSAEEIAEVLTMGGLEVDSIERTGQPLEGVVVGRVERVRAHPNADRLVLCDVALGGDGSEPKQIACGAPNVAEGQRVPVATVGARLMLPAKGADDGERQPVTIEAVELRGERSEGMICSEHELGLGDDASGILVLNENAPVGQPLASYLAARGAEPSDAVLDIDLTPNRPDATSHLGVARDLAALTDQPLQRPDVPLPEAGGAAGEALSVEIEAPEACPRYAGMLVRGVDVEPSPEWLQRRLRAVGLQPRNSVVDATNFVMYECGQPLHAFDFAQIAGEKIIVRLTEGEESFTTLDDKERTLPEGALLICDAGRPVAIAGVMGGQNSEVSDATTDVLIESAYFDPSTIRRTAKALDLSTDASYRFERGIDRDGQLWAAARAAELITEIAGGTIVPGVVDAHPAPPAPQKITLRPARANALLGTDLSVEAMADLLDAVGIETEREDEHLECTAPTFRPDLTREVDLIEEIARLHGYDCIPAPAHVPLPARPPREEPARRLRRRTRALLAGMGLREIQTNSMLPKEKAARFLTGESSVVETLKPISEAMAALRPRLLPGALAAMRFNRNRGQDALRLFEFGHVFRRTQTSGGSGPVPGYAEHEALGLALSGPAQEAAWNAEARDTDFYDLKGLLESLLERLRVPGIAMEPFGSGADPNFAYGLRLALGGTALGVAGKVAEEEASAFDLDAPVFAAELHWPALVRAAVPQQALRYAPPLRFPSVERDLAVVVDEGAPAAALLATIRAAGEPLLQEARLFDRYAGEGVGGGRKSLAFALRFQAARTLEDHDVDEKMRVIVSSLEEDHDATLRE